MHLSSCARALQQCLVSPGARELLDRALADRAPPVGASVRPRSESWNRDYSRGESYRGVNANMHTVDLPSCL